MPDVAPLDGDGDGVIDELDNCPAAANPDQANEDGDALGDRCDPCPPFGGGAPTADLDADGVGDLCDPFPERAGDRIEVFEGLASAPAGVELAGTWMFQGGQAIAPSSLNQVSAATWNIAGGRETVSTRATIDVAFGSNVARPVGVVHRFNAPTTDGITCVFGINPSNAEVFALANNGTTAALDSAPAVAGEGASSTFFSTRTGTSYVCDGSAGPRPLTDTAPLMVTPNRVGLFTRSVSARFDWVMIVTSPP